tara:strand:+ start:412 stop:747 length:336 start_codon:yes stop_codon:yes gene_type:complete
VKKIVLGILFLMLSSTVVLSDGVPVPTGKGRTYNDNKEKDKQYVTCRLAKKKIVLTQKICIYLGPNRTTDTVFIDRFEYCPRQIQCIYEPNKSTPMIEEMMKSMEESLKKR